MLGFMNLNPMLLLLFVYCVEIVYYHVLHHCTLHTHNMQLQTRSMLPNFILNCKTNVILKFYFLNCYILVYISHMKYALLCFDGVNSVYNYVI